jgi:FixJ family two-component response regulator
MAPPQLDDLGQQQTESTRRPVDEGDVAGLHWIEVGREVETLTPREQEVMMIVVTGRPNKQIAAELKLSEMTVKIHRGQLMRKMKAKSLVDLVRMADMLKESSRDSRAS